jgi:hypothetical protein
MGLAGSSKLVGNRPRLARLRKDAIPVEAKDNGETLNRSRNKSEQKLKRSSEVVDCQYED